MAPNNILPNAHFRKHWQLRVKTWFDQPGRKKTRQAARKEKAVAHAPRPLGGKLRPAVRCMTIRYNRRLRIGRGFSLDEMRAVKMSPKYARTVGIAVDHRRKNRSEESLQRNVERLRTYLKNLVLFKSEKNLTKLVKRNKDTKRGKVLAMMRKNPALTEEEAFAAAEKLVRPVFGTVADVNQVVAVNKPVSTTVEARAILPGEHKFHAFTNLRKARVLARHHQSRLLRSKAAAEIAAQKK